MLQTSTRISGLVFADGKQQMRELALRHLVEHIALILVRVHAAQEQVTARRRVEADAGVVPSGNIVEAVVERPVEHRAELQLTVAVQAGVRGAARAVFRDEMPHDLAAEKVAQVEHILNAKGEKENLAFVGDGPV